MFIKINVCIIKAQITLKILIDTCR